MEWKNFLSFFNEPFPKVAALDESLSELNLIDMMTQPSNSEYVWKTINDFHKDPYTTGFQMFSKMNKALFSPHEETRPEEEMAELLQVKYKSGQPETDIFCFHYSLVSHFGFLSGNC